jgi:biofilm PGA synthesis protein PgaA
VLALAFWGAAPLPHAGAQDASRTPASPLNEAAAKRLQRLKEQADRNPGNRAYLHDYLQALEEAGRDAELLALRPRVDPASAPATVIARIARAAANTKQFPLAVELFESALARAPDRVDLLAGLSYALIDAGRPADAQAQLEARRDLLQKHVPLLDAYAQALRARREYAQSLLAYDRILALEPANREAQRDRIFTVAQLGAPHRAVELAEQSPGLLSDAELAQLRGDRAAIAARWGAAADQNAPDRFAGTDAALTENARLLASAAGPGKKRLQLDRVVLLRNRYRMQEAADLYREIAAGGGDIPPYAQVAAADAYLYLEQPEQARDLYKAAIAGGGVDIGAQFGLFYAYNDAEEHEAAIEQIDRVVAETPTRVRAYSPLTEADNPDHASAVATAGAARGYQDRLNEAQMRLERFRSRAPWNMEGRERLAGVYAARGWPRRAAQEYQWILAAEPRNRAARVGRADMQRELRDWRTAESEALALELEYPEDRQVQRVGRLWGIHQMRELLVEAGSGRSSGSAGPLGSREHQVESWLFSSPIRYDWRAFLHQYDAQASFPDGRGHWRRIGAGAEYRLRDWRASVEATTGYGGDEDVGLALAGDWSMDDHWNFEAEAETSTTDIPLQGRNAGVEGKSLRLGATYRISESRRFALGAQAIDFSDGNNREILSATAFQRLYSGPVYKLDGILGLYASRNSLDNANYFNPESDFGTDLTLVGEQRLWRRYDRSFTHRAFLMLGSYRQQSFGSGATGGIRYEHEWSLDDRLTILYGAQRTFHPYDGVREYMNWYNVMLNWRF